METKIIILNFFGLFVSLSILLLILFKRIKTTFFVLFIGTVFHELLHYIVAVTLNGKPTNFSIKPKIQNGEVFLGGMNIQNPNIYNIVFIAMAPICLGFFVWTFHTFIQNHLYLPLWILLCIKYLEIVFLYSMIPSKEDFLSIVLTFKGQST